jgi:PKD repeat protein
VVNVYPVPTASFNINITNQCLANNSFTFSNTSTISAGTLLFQWFFGDGTTANTISPAHAYTVAGTYTVKLIVTTGNGCKDSITKQVVVNPQSTASFTANAANQCISGNNYLFTNTSAVTGTATYKWYFGDGGTSILFSPAYSYTLPGNYIVKLMVTTSNGCVDSISKPVTVYPQPITLFNVNATNQCQTSNNFIFTNNSSITSGTISYFWRFGDGGLSNANNPTHAYASAGTYNVILLTVSNFGCRDSISQIVNVNPQPTATFAVNNLNQCFNANNFVFTNNSIATGTPAYQWQFGDGNVSSSASPSHIYTTPGIYTVKLNVTSGSGCKDSTSQTVTVYPKPAAAFSINTVGQCLNGNSFAFTNNTTVSSGSFSSAWDFGDGQTSTGISPLHIYTSSGTYIVKLVVTTNNGCKDSTSVTVNVYPKPQVSFVPNQSNQCLTGNSFVFTNNSVSQGLTNYIWTFGDGSSSGAQNPLHIYTVQGVYTVKLVVVSGNGCKDSTSVTVTVFPKPTASFSANLNAQCFETNNFLFNNNSSVSPGTFTSVWSFGDGTYSSVNTPSHVYAASGTYTVKLVVTTNNGCKDSTSNNVVVSPQPKAQFNINDSTQCLKGNMFNFGNASVVSGTGIYQWGFGDATTSAIASPSHVYTSAGTYNVKLIVYTIAGCKDSIMKQVIVFPKVTASFNINIATQCLRGNNFVFANTASVTQGTLTMDWGFGDGLTSSQTNPVHSYTTSGNFSAKLIATSDKGCKDTTTLPVVVNPMPVAAFNINNTMQCLLGNNFVFTNASTGTAPINYKWTFGDGNIDNQVSTAHHYNISGS